MLDRILSMEIYALLKFYQAFKEVQIRMQIEDIIVQIPMISLPYTPPHSMPFCLP